MQFLSFYCLKISVKEQKSSISPFKLPSNQSINQPNNQSTNQSTNQSINQSIQQSVNWPIDRSINQSTNRMTKHKMWRFHYKEFWENLFQLLSCLLKMTFSTTFFFLLFWCPQRIPLRLFDRPSRCSYAAAPMVCYLRKKKKFIKSKKDAVSFGISVQKMRNLKIFYLEGRRRNPQKWLRRCALFLPFGFLLSPHRLSTPMFCGKNGKRHRN